ncbi:DUF1285 domain-containing protein [Pinisolibacter sp.]|uniref:DUF1285 domain-containing protein n=1 Tax=Pinisolibacter sp. TaxID=2172024 RepID=UPI003FA7D52F
MSEATKRDTPGEGLASLMAKLGGAGEGRGPAPVERWNPPFCGDIDMRIAADGTWYYCGTPIGREAMVRLFASVLRRDEDGRTYLVTPVEKCGITVDDVAFVAVELQVEGAGREQVLGLRTNVGDRVVVDDDHPLRFEIDAVNGGLKPYVRVRGRLEARLARPVLYDLVALGESETLDGREWFGVRSSGRFFPIVPADEIEAIE